MSSSSRRSSGFARGQHVAVGGDAGRRDVDGRSVEVDGAVGAAPHGGAVGTQGERPAALVDEVVVAAAQRQQVVEMRAASRLPWADVVDVAVVEADGAAGMGAGAVHRPQRSALFAGGDALGMPDVQGDTVTVEHDRHDVSVAAQPAHRGDGDCLAGRCLAHRTVVQPVAQRVEVDEHGHLGRAAARAAGAGDQPDEGVGLDLVEGPVIGAVGLFGGDRCAERRSDGGVGQRIQHQIGVAQPGDPIDPATHATLPAQVLVTTHPVVVRQDLTELAHLTAELLRPTRSSPNRPVSTPTL